MKWIWLFDNWNNLHFFLSRFAGEGSYAKVKEALNTETLERAAVKNLLTCQVKTHPQRHAECSEGSEHSEKVGPSQCLSHEGAVEEGAEEETLSDYGLCSLCH